LGKVALDVARIPYLHDAKVVSTIYTMTEETKKETDDEDDSPSEKKYKLTALNSNIGHATSEAKISAEVFQKKTTAHRNNLDALEAAISVRDIKQAALLEIEKKNHGDQNYRDMYVSKVTYATNILNEKTHTLHDIETETHNAVLDAVHRPFVVDVITATWYCPSSIDSRSNRTLEKDELLATNGGNQNSTLASACNNHEKCDYTVSSRQIGEASAGCPEGAYHATFKCIRRGVVVSAAAPDKLNSGSAMSLIQISAAQSSKEVEAELTAALSANLPPKKDTTISVKDALKAEEMKLDALTGKVAAQSGIFTVELNAGPDGRTLHLECKQDSEDTKLLNAMEKKDLERDSYEAAQEHLADTIMKAVYDQKAKIALIASEAAAEKETASAALTESTEDRVKAEVEKAKADSLKAAINTAPPEVDKAALEAKFAKAAEEAQESQSKADAADAAFALANAKAEADKLAAVSENKKLDPKKEYAESEDVLKAEAKVDTLRMSFKKVSKEKIALGAMLRSAATNGEGSSSMEKGILRQLAEKARQYMAIEDELSTAVVAEEKAIVGSAEGFEGDQEFKPLTVLEKGELLDRWENRAEVNTKKLDSLNDKLTLVRNTLHQSTDASEITKLLEDMASLSASVVNTEKRLKSSKQYIQKIHDAPIKSIEEAEKETEEGIAEAEMSLEKLEEKKLALGKQMLATTDPTKVKGLKRNIGELDDLIKQQRDANAALKAEAAMEKKQALEDAKDDDNSHLDGLATHDDKKDTKDRVAESLAKQLPAVAEALQAKKDARANYASSRHSLSDLITIKLKQVDAVNRMKIKDARKEMRKQVRELRKMMRMRKKLALLVQGKFDPNPVLSAVQAAFVDAKYHDAYAMYSNFDAKSGSCEVGGCCFNSFLDAKCADKQTKKSICSKDTIVPEVFTWQPLVTTQITQGPTKVKGAFNTTVDVYGAWKPTEAGGQQFILRVCGDFTPGEETCFPSDNEPTMAFAEAFNAGNGCVLSQDFVVLSGTYLKTRCEAFVRSMTPEAQNTKAKEKDAQLHAQNMEEKKQLTSIQNSIIGGKDILGEDIKADMVSAVSGALKGSFAGLGEPNDVSQTEQAESELVVELGSLDLDMFVDATVRAVEGILSYRGSFSFTSM